MRISNRRIRSTAAPRSARRGFGLVEILFAIVVSSIAMLGLGGMLVTGARTATQISTRTNRAAIAAQQLNRIASLSYDVLDAQAGCVAVSTPPLAHTRCISISNVGGGMGAKQVRLIITPSNSVLKPDTTYLTRSKGQTVNPLGT
jgi:prepilin-type N-terminal cleavage/methylation domain-containing protein